MTTQSHQEKKIKKLNTKVHLAQVLPRKTESELFHILDELVDTRRWLTAAATSGPIRTTMETTL
jgi:uncharacterized coiled-coil protein SlyX